MSKAQKLSATLSKAESNLLGLMHSALDIDDTRLHTFSQWLTSPEFTQAPPHHKEKDHLAKVQLLQPIKFHNYSADKHHNYAGYGLASVQKFEADSPIAQLSTEVGLVSNIFMEDQTEDSLATALIENTEQVTGLFFPGPQNQV